MSARRFGAGPRTVRWILAGGLLAFGGVSFAAYQAVQFWRTPTAPKTVAKAVTVSRARPASDERNSSVPPAAADPIAAPAIDTPATAASPQPRSKLALVASRSGGSRATSSPSHGDVALEAETQSLRSAIGRLRRDRDAASALGELERHLDRFPKGAFLEEASVARADALLILGRREDALAALERLGRGREVLGAEVRVIRGELRAATNCTAAIADFTAVIDGGAADRLYERALRGRALCGMRLGHRVAAQRDYEQYLRRFPEGGFASEARASAGSSK